MSYSRLISKKLRKTSLTDEIHVKCTAHVWCAALDARGYAPALAKGNSPTFGYLYTMKCWLGITVDDSASLRVIDECGGLLVNSLLSNPTKMVLLEVAKSAKEDLLGVSLFGFLVFNCGQLEFTYVIGNLLKPEIFGTAIPINNDLSTQCVFECHIQRRSHGFLSIVVVKLNGVVCLEHAKPFRKKNDKVLPHFAEHCGVGTGLVSLVREREVLDGAFKCEGAEACRESHPRLDGHVSISVVSPHKRIHVQRDIRKVVIPENLLVPSNLLLDGYGLPKETPRLLRQAFRRKVCNLHARNYQ